MSMRLGPFAPVEVAELYERLWQEVAALRLEWLLYRQVFAGPQTDLDVLIDTAPVFFTFAQNIWMRDVIRAISSLTDPSRQAGKKNQTLAALIEAIPGDKQSPALKSELAEVDKSCRVLRDHRNRNIAHYDLHTRRVDPAVPLEPISRADIERALGAIGHLLNFVAVLFEVPRTSFEERVAPDADGDQMILLLRIGRNEGRQE